MKIIPVVGKTYYGKWFHYSKPWKQRQLNGEYKEFNERRSTYKVKRALTVTPCHSCPCRCIIEDCGEFDHWGCSLGAEVVELPTRMDNKYYLDSSLTTDSEVIGSEDCPLISIQHRGGVYLKPTATVTVYEIKDSSQYRQKMEVPK
jgi:hypothetical protein